MYFVPFAILVAALDPDFVTAHGLGPRTVALTWSASWAGTCCR